MKEKTNNKNISVKDGIIIILITIITILLLVMLVVLNKDKKDKIAATEFKTILEKQDYTVEDRTSEASEFQAVKKLYVAFKENIKIEFYVLKNEDAAIMAFVNGEKTFDNDKTDNYSEYVKKGDNYSIYSRKLDGKYNYVVRVDNTLIYTSVDKKYKSDINKVIDDLDY